MTQGTYSVVQGREARVAPFLYDQYTRRWKIHTLFRDMTAEQGPAYVYALTTLGNDLTVSSGVNSDLQDAAVSAAALTPGQDSLIVNRLAFMNWQIGRLQSLQIMGGGGAFFDQVGIDAGNMLANAIDGGKTSTSSTATVGATKTVLSDMDDASYDPAAAFTINPGAATLTADMVWNARELIMGLDGLPEPVMIGNPVGFSRIQELGSTVLAPNATMFGPITSPNAMRPQEGGYSIPLVGRVGGIEFFETPSVPNKLITASPVAASITVTANVATVVFVGSPGYVPGQKLSTVGVFHDSAAATVSLSGAAITTTSLDGSGNLTITIPWTAANGAFTLVPNTANTGFQEQDTAIYVLDRSNAFFAAPQLPSVEIVPRVDAAGDVGKVSMAYGAKVRQGRCFKLLVPGR